MDKILRPHFFVVAAFLLAFLAAPLAAENQKDRITTLVDRFTNEKKLYLLLDKGLCFEIVGEVWRCDQWLPGDTMKIQSLYGYSSFNFSITNLATDQTNDTVYAKFAYVDTENASYDYLRKRVDDLEERVMNLEKGKKKL